MTKKLSLQRIAAHKRQGWERFDLPTWADDAAEYNHTGTAPVYVNWDGASLLAVLGDIPESDAPDVYIERLPERWIVSIHTDLGDPLLGINILDDGSPVVVEDAGGEALLTLERPGQP